jgi:DNA polymerase III alpha subunit
MDFPAYAELHCLSNFSFLRGASHPEELVARGAKLGYRALAITDECSFTGMVRAHIEAKRLSLPLIIGSELRLTILQSRQYTFARMISGIKEDQTKACDHRLLTSNVRGVGTLIS